MPSRQNQKIMPFIYRSVSSSRDPDALEGDASRTYMAAEYTKRLRAATTLKDLLTLDLG